MVRGCVRPARECCTRPRCWACGVAAGEHEALDSVSRGKMQMKDGMCKIIVRGLRLWEDYSGRSVQVPFDQIEIECPASSFDQIWKDLKDRGLLPGGDQVKLELDR